MSIVKAHSHIHELIEVAHYEDHEQRSESAEFRKVKQEFHKNHAKCFIDNGKCEGNVEIHHSIIEYAASSEVDWEKVIKDYPEFVDVDNKAQMMPLCAKHHRGKGFGIHNLTYSIWILQKYMKPEALEQFEKDVNEALK